MCMKTKVRYSCDCDATVIEQCAFTNDNPVPCPNFRHFNRADEDICPRCQDKFREKQRKEQNKKDKAEERRMRERQIEEEEERTREFVRAQAFEAGYNDERSRQETASRSYNAIYGYGYNATDMRYARGAVEENQRMEQGRSSRELQRQAARTYDGFDEYDYEYLTEDQGRQYLARW